MSVTDPIADMLVMIKNASRAKKEKVDVPASNITLAIVEVLKKEGFVKNYKKIEDNKQGVLRIYLKMPEGQSVINEMKRISKPGRRVYVNKNEIPSVLGGLGLAIISTSQGIMTDREARQKKIGGEVICYVW
jgi:small subunit ribosomal protein S8